MLATARCSLQSFKTHTSGFNEAYVSGTIIAEKCITGYVTLRD